MDGKHFESGTFRKRWRHDIHVIFLSKFSSNTNPKYPVIVGVVWKGRGLKSFVIPPNQIRSPIGGERVMCRGSKLTNSLGCAKLTNSPWKQNMNIRLARDQVVLLETAANLWASHSEANYFFVVFFYFWVGRYNKTLNDWSRKKEWILFSLDLGETRITVSLGVSHEVLIVIFSAVDIFVLVF